jgi:alpha-beta hydrolase superfamily lysophospholipase
MNTQRSFIEKTMTSWDGARLFYRAWLPARSGAGRGAPASDEPGGVPGSPPSTKRSGAGAADKALVLFHRGHEHSGRWQDVIDALALDDVAIFAWDARGHGRSSGERGAADSVATLVKDADAFVRHLTSTYGVHPGKMIAIGHSVGAVVAAAWVHDYAPPICGLVLATPAFRVKLYVPGAVPLLRLRHALFGAGFVKSYVKAKLLTHDPSEADRYVRDPLIFRQIAVNMLLDLHDTSTRLIADAGAIHTPTLILGAGADWVVRLDAQRRFFDGLSSRVKEMHVYPGFFHALLHERDRHLPIAKLRDFIARRFAAPTHPPALIDSDSRGHTKNEYDRLRAPGGRRYVPVRWALETVGRLSEGMRLGWRTGFDSGLTLDYVYENHPRGVTPVGLLIDRAYLSSIGWRGIRQRRVHLQRMLASTIERVHGERRPAHVLDLAAGPGRYVLESIHAARVPVTAVLRDSRAENIEAGKALCTSLGLRGVSFERGDAFDRTSVASLRPRPTIAIVSGLYELFPENALVMASLRGLADAVEHGGYLLYTNQPWHPQLEFIARTLINRDGRPWIMRRRTQAEMDELVRTAGFRKISMEIDQWGIFSVSLAERVAA